MTLDDIRHLLATNDRAVERAVVAIYRRQTASEQRSRCTLKENGVGFNAPDARFLTDIAKILLRGEAISFHQLAECRARVTKYSSQLLDIAMERELLKLSQD